MLALTPPPAPAQPRGSLLQRRGLQLEVEELLQDGRVVSPGAQVGDPQSPAGARVSHGRGSARSPRPQSSPGLGPQRPRGRQERVQGHPGGEMGKRGVREPTGPLVERAPEHPPGPGLCAVTPQAGAHLCCAVWTGPPRSRGPWLGSGSPCAGWGPSGVPVPSVASRWHSPEGQ